MVVQKKIDQSLHLVVIFALIKVVDKITETCFNTVKVSVHDNYGLVKVREQCVVTTLNTGTRY